jgi:X-Pro dipeptidyl-peptidase (S15 family)
MSDDGHRAGRRGPPRDEEREGLMAQNDADDSGTAGRSARQALRQGSGFARLHTQGARPAGGSARRCRARDPAGHVSRAGREGELVRRKVSVTRLDRPWRLPGLLRPAVSVYESAAGSLTVLRDLAVVVRDGTILRVNVVLPAGAGRFPVLLSAHPYGKDNLPRRTAAARHRAPAARMSPGARSPGGHVPPSGPHGTPQRAQVPMPAWAMIAVIADSIIGWMAVGAWPMANPRHLTSSWQAAAARPPATQPETKPRPPAKANGLPHQGRHRDHPGHEHAANQIAAQSRQHNGTPAGPTKKGKCQRWKATSVSSSSSP